MSKKISKKLPYFTEDYSEKLKTIVVNAKDFVLEKKLFDDGNGLEMFRPKQRSKRIIKLYLKIHDELEKSESGSSDKIFKKYNKRRKNKIDEQDFMNWMFTSKELDEHSESD